MRSFLQNNFILQSASCLAERLEETNNYTKSPFESSS